MEHAVSANGDYENSKERDLPSQKSTKKKKKTFNETEGEHIKLKRFCKPKKPINMFWFMKL